MEQKIGDKTEDLNIQPKKTPMGSGKTIAKIIIAIINAIETLNKKHDKMAPWSGIVVLSILGVLIMISPWMAVIVIILTMAARIAYLEKWLKILRRPFNPF